MTHLAEDEVPSVKKAPMEEVQALPLVSMSGSWGAGWPVGCAAGHLEVGS